MVNEADIVKIESDLYEVLGILRMIGKQQIDGGSENIFEDFESVIWAARAAETIVDSSLTTIELFRR